jgi:hypothetical protein
MAIVDKAWDGSASRYPDTPTYCDCCAINTNTGDRDKWVQENCKLPYKEPDGDINKNALGPAAAALNGARGGLTGVSAADKKAAAKKLVSAYNEAQMSPPPSLKNMAS